MEYLSKLFGSPARVKILRLFMFHPDRVYDRDSVVAAARITPETASKELASLARAGVMQRKTFYKEVVRPGSTAIKKRKTVGWVLCSKYPHIDALDIFLRDTLIVSGVEIRKRLRGVGSIKLLVLSGFLIGEKDTGLDMLIVGNKLNEQSVKNVLRVLEAECGQEIRYALLTTEEYQYRRRVRDKLVRGVMDYPHKEVVDKLATVL